MECAAPACYASCDLYQPRADGRCRRFAYGAFKNFNFPSLRGYGVEISFKKWAKIEAFGNTTISPVDSVLRWERLAETGALLTNILGHVANRATGKQKWAELSYIAAERLVRRFDTWGVNETPPEAFLLEVYNPAKQEIRLQIIFGASLDDQPSSRTRMPMAPPVVNTIVLPFGYSRHEFPAKMFSQFRDRGIPFKITMVPEADNDAHLVFLTADLVTFKNRAAATTSTRNIKCILWDLDNTLWQGTLIEGDDVVLRPGIADLLRCFDERGILLSVVSKNDFEPAWEKLTAFGISDYFLYPQFDWLPKSQKIKNVATQLNIGTDSIAFVDDNPFELDEAARAIPELVTISAETIDSLASDPRFQGSVTQESRQRRKMYQQQISRELHQEEFGEDYIGFLASCDIVLEISGYAEEERERVAELTQRTNQLNFSGHKYSRDELREIVANPALGKYILRCSDKYGSYGAVGFCLVRNTAEAVEIVDFMLSCRVQSKFIEQALFSHLLEHHNPRSATSIWVNFHQTGRNTPARRVLEAIGFRPCNSAEDGFDKGVILYESRKCNFIEVRCFVPSSTLHREGGGARAEMSSTHGSGK